MNQFPNKAGDHADTDDILRAELKAAGIQTLQEADNYQADLLDDFLRQSSAEVKTSVRGILHGWKFERAARYWSASGPGINADAALKLQALHGKTVRVAGHCGSPDPVMWFKGLAVGFYHIDDAEGLKAIADTIKGIVELSKQTREVQFLTKLADLIDQYNAEIYYTNRDDGVHLAVDGNSIWNGALERYQALTLKDFHQTENLRKHIADLTKQSAVESEQSDETDSATQAQKYEERIKFAMSVDGTGNLGSSWNTHFKSTLNSLGLKLVVGNPFDYKDQNLYPFAGPHQAPLLTQILR